MLCKGLNFKLSSHWTANHLTIWVGVCSDTNLILFHSSDEVCVTGTVHKQLFCVEIIAPFMITFYASLLWHGNPFLTEPSKLQCVGLPLLPLNSSEDAFRMIFQPRREYKFPLWRAEIIAFKGDFLFTSILAKEEIRIDQSEGVHIRIVEFTLTA